MSAPNITHVLNDPIWQNAAVFDVFTTVRSSHGKQPSERTSAYLTYDRNNIYVGFHAFDSEPSKVKCNASRRDNPEDDDWVAFCLSPDETDLRAFFFLVTPSGLQTDGTLDAAGHPNTHFNMQWKSAATKTADGWTAEMVIPFKSLPFSWANHMVMAFKLARYIGRKSEEADYPNIVDDRESQIAQFQRIQLSNTNQSLVPVDVPLIDLEEARQERLKLRMLPSFNQYEGRVRDWGDASVFDYLAFPSHALTPAPTPFHFERNHHNNTEVAKAFQDLEYAPGKQVGDIDSFLRNTLTTSFIVIRNDRILYEKYFNGFDRDSIVTSFSVAKSFVSMLIGIAIDEGLIDSESDAITKYLPELSRRDERFNKIAIEDLLMMSAGLRYQEGPPSYDNRITYYDPDLRKAALEKTEIIDAPGKYWLYNNYHPLLIGMILERATGKTVTQYLQEKLWNPLGMEYAGSWSTNSDNNGLEKMESGINARAVDFAKLGRLT